jgi:hypothetical protein
MIKQLSSGLMARCYVILALPMHGAECSHDVNTVLKFKTEEAMKVRLFMKMAMTKVDD